MSMNLDDIAILNINGADYRCVIAGTSKIEVINLMQNIDFSEKKAKHYKIQKKLFSHIKMGEEILMLRELEIEKKELTL